MILTTQMTKDYFDKAHSLFDTVAKYWPFRFVLGCIGFTPGNYYKGEFFRVEKENVKSYRDGYPVNRQGYVCMQAGEFADYIDCPDDEILVYTDADVIMQYCFDDWHRDVIAASLLSNDLLSVYCAKPPIPLRTVLNYLGCKIPDQGLQRLWGGHWQNVHEFTASFMIARKSFFKTLASEYLDNFDNLMLTTAHHAGGQWLINWICTRYKVFILPPTFQCGEWYQTFNTSCREGLLYIDENPVLFNHTKFNS